MQQIDQLIQILDTLLGPEGCPWDRKQTMATIKEDILEEACEVLDAIDAKDPEAISEELGDLFFGVLFLCRLAEKENMGQLPNIIQGISDKLVRRHPHVFHIKTELTEDEHKKQWEEIKNGEKKHPRHPIERIPRALPALGRAMEIVQAAKKLEWDVPEVVSSDPELEMGNALLELVKESCEKGINPELALRRVLVEHEKTLVQKYPI